MRNLFLGYFHTPRNKRAEVLRLMGNVVGLERDDVDKVSGHALFLLLSILFILFLPFKPHLKSLFHPFHVSLGFVPLPSHIESAVGLRDIIDEDC